MCNLHNPRRAEESGETAYVSAINYIYLPVEEQLCSNCLPAFIYCFVFNQLYFCAIPKLGL